MSAARPLAMRTRRTSLDHHAAGAGQADARRSSRATLQQRYQGIKDFSANFVHTYRGGVLRTQTREEGIMQVKKPGMMRFIYIAPEKKEFVSDGVKVYSYIPEDKQVVIASVPPDNQATTPALFLAGKGDISRDYHPVYVDSSVPGALGLKLIPKRQSRNTSIWCCRFEPATLQWRLCSQKTVRGGNRPSSSRT
jgi:outer membrane lipoprotein-sorting protein